MSELIKVIIRDSGPFDIHGDHWKRYPSFRPDGTKIGNDVEWAIRYVTQLLCESTEAFLYSSPEELQVKGRLLFEVYDPPFGVIWGKVEIYGPENGAQERKSDHV